MLRKPSPGKAGHGAAHGTWQAVQTHARRADARGTGEPETRRNAGSSHLWPVQLRVAFIVSVIFYDAFLCTVKTNVTL